MTMQIRLAAVRRSSSLPNRRCAKPCSVGRRTSRITPAARIDIRSGLPALRAWALTLGLGTCLILSTGATVALNQWNRFADGRSLRLPTLLIWGDQDVIVDRDATTRTLIAIPGANNLEVLHNVGHSPMIEAPELLVERITDFITEDFVGFEDVRRIATEDINEDIDESAASA